MKTIHLASGTYLLVEVPEDAKVFYLTSGGIAGRKLLCFKDELLMAEIPISHGNWERIGKASELTEDQWKGIVNFWEATAPSNYECPNPNPIRYFECYERHLSGYLTATESGLSLLASHGLEKETTLILKMK